MIWQLLATLVAEPNSFSIGLSPHLSIVLLCYSYQPFRFAIDSTISSFSNLNEIQMVSSANNLHCACGFHCTIAVHFMELCLLSTTWSWYFSETVWSAWPMVWVLCACFCLTVQVKSSKRLHKATKCFVMLRCLPEQCNPCHSQPTQIIPPSTASNPNTNPLPHACPHHLWKSEKGEGMWQNWKIMWDNVQNK